MKRESMHNRIRLSLSRKRRRGWRRRLAAIAACAVAAGTLWSLSLPAVTGEVESCRLVGGVLTGPVPAREDAPAGPTAETLPDPAPEATPEEPETLEDTELPSAPAGPEDGSEVQTEAQTEAQTEVQTETQTEAQTETQTEAQTGAQTEAQTGKQNEVQPETRTDAPPETQPDGQTGGTEAAAAGAAAPARSPEERPSLLLAQAWRSAGTVYSSDLADFVTEVIIRDGQGNTIPAGGTVYIGENYEITIAFSEDNIAGQEKQFQYDENGYLTYQIPPYFICPPVPNGVLADAGGIQVGTYTIDSGGLLRVQFGPGYIDSSKASMRITFTSTASSGQGTGLQPIDFGGYTIQVNVSGAGELEVEKTALDYDPRTHTVAYQVRVMARHGTVENVVFTDTPTSTGLTVDPASMVYTSLDGLTVYSTPPSTLNAGEGYLVQYRASLPASAYQNVANVSYRAKNTASAAGDSQDGPVQAQAVEEKWISTKFLQKSGKDEPSNGRIRWTVTVGDGSTVVDGLTLTDAPDSGLAFDTAAGISAVPYTWAGGQLQAQSAIPIPFGTPPGQIALPAGQNAYQYVLTYYTTYSLPAGVNSQGFSNTVTASDTLHGTSTVTKTVTAHAAGAPPDIVKTVERNAQGTALHYVIGIDVPAAYGGTSGFYLTDTYTKVTYGGTEYFFGSGIQNLSVHTLRPDDSTQIYLPYEGGPADYTYRFNPSSDPRTFSLYFNTASSSSTQSCWIEPEDTTLYVEYDLPLTAPVFLRPDGSTYVPSHDVTVGDLIEAELPLDNRGRIYYNNKLLYADANASYRDVSVEPFRKKGEVNVDGEIEYTVIFNNRDAAGNTLLQKKMKQLIFHDALLSQGMRYVDGSLFCDIYNSGLDRIRTVYRYSPAIGGPAALDASAADFLWYSGDNPEYTTLYEYAQHSRIGGSSSSTSRLVFRYRVAVDKTAPIFATNAPTVPLSNRARLTGILPDDAPFDTGPADCTVDYSTQIVQKEVTHTEGSNRADFTITMNPAGVDLLDGVTRMTVLDRMTANLRPVLHTIRVYQKAAGVWTEMTPQYTYDDQENLLTFVLPDDVPLRITYTTIITQTGEGISIGNSISLENYAQYSAVVNTQFTVDETGGAAQTDNFRLSLLKQSSDHHQALAGAAFALYGPQHAERQGTAPAGTPATVSVGGRTLWYYTTYITGANGTALVETNGAGLALFSVQGLYALKEIAAPQGYEPIADPIFFYADQRPAGGLAEVPVMLSDTPLVVPNDPVTFQLPDTGGMGAGTVRVLGALAAGGGLLARLAEKAGGRPPALLSNIPTKWKKKGKGRKRT